MPAAETKCVLVIDDENSIREMLEVALKKWNFRAKFAKNLKEGVAAIERGKIDVVLSDIKLPDGLGIDVLDRVKTLPEAPPVILMTAFGNTDAAVQAMKLGAFYYVTKPFKLDELKILIERALAEEGLKEENTKLRKAVAKEFSVESIIGKTKVMKDLFLLIERLSKTKTNVLITGESGTGKELVARAIHYGGVFKNKPFVAINCGAIPENLIESELFGHKRGSFTGAVSDKDGLFEVANGGTIFLDEIGELPVSMQVKLLRVLQDRSFRAVGGTENVSVDVRVISATNKDLEQATKKGMFREDLYYRLNVINLKAPPLRDRKEDIPELVQHFVSKFNVGMGKSVAGVSAEAMQCLMAYAFPGNVRELENMMERAMALEGSLEIQVDSLPPSVQALRGAGSGDEGVLGSSSAGTITPVRVDLEKIVEDIERKYIVDALQKAGGVKKKAAELLGISFRSIRYRISKYGIDDPEGDTGGEDHDGDEGGHGGSQAA